MLKFIDGDRGLFDQVESAFFYGLVKSLPYPGAHSKHAYLLAGEKASFFIKPDSNNNHLKEILAWELAKKMGLQNFFLPVCSFEMIKNEHKVIITANPIMPDNCISFQDLESERKGALDGVIETLIKSSSGHRLALFDLLLGNKDRHRGNCFVNNGQVVLIDHSEAFAKTEGGWIPAVLRKSNYKKGDFLPLCENEHELREWVNSLNFSNKEFQDKIEFIKKVPARIDAAINYEWMTIT